MDSETASSKLGTTKPFESSAAMVRPKGVPAPTELGGWVVTISCVAGPVTVKALVTGAFKPRLYVAWSV